MKSQERMRSLQKKSMHTGLGRKGAQCMEVNRDMCYRSWSEPLGTVQGCLCFTCVYIGPCLCPSPGHSAALVQLALATAELFMDQTWVAFSLKGQITKT